MLYTVRIAAPVTQAFHINPTHVLTYPWPPLQELFSLLRTRATEVAEQRAPAGRFNAGRPPAYSFAVECSFCELYCEELVDLLAPSGHRRPLEMVEDRVRGWHARNLTGALSTDCHWPSEGILLQID